MLPFGLQPLHLIIIVVVALLIFGPSRLPEMGRGMGKMITEFRKGIKGGGDETDQASNANQLNLTQTTPPSQPINQPINPGPETNSNNVFCGQCGAPNPGNAKFCNKCVALIAQ